MEKETTEKSVLRTKSIGTKVSEDEYAALEKLAEARGLTLGEWLRELALAEVIAHPAQQVILGEILALRMLYLNTVQILGRGRELGTDDLRKLIERVDREKQAMARERLAGQVGDQADRSPKKMSARLMEFKTAR